MIHKTISAFILSGCIVLSAPLNAQTNNDIVISSPAVLDLETWSSLDQEERRAILLASIEATLLASEKHQGLSEALDDDCLSTLTMKRVEKTMQKQARKNPSKTYHDAFLDIVTCKESSN